MDAPHKLAGKEGFHMNRRFGFMIGGGCLLIGAILAGIILLVISIPITVYRNSSSAPARQQPTFQSVRQVLQAAPTFTPAASAVATATQPVSGTSTNGGGASTEIASLLRGRYEQLHPGVVNIQVLTRAAADNTSNDSGVGLGAGSGFILDTQGHIVTNNHVVADATQVIAIFYNGIQAEAQVIGTDGDSDLAVIQVQSLPQGTHPLPLGDSDRLQVGDWVIAIGNPFGLGGSMTLGIVSALGRAIPGAASFSIPQAVQTDAAINPGNSGGPLIDLAGEVMGVNAQIQTGGGNGNTGVGFAIPANAVRHVIPSLIANGAYQWPWLGVESVGEDSPLNWLIVQANQLNTQQGAYITRVVPNGPAAKAGLRGSTSTATVSGIPDIPVGGDLVLAVDGQPISNFNDLLAYVAFKAPGDKLVLTILRDGKQSQLTVTLEPRPANVAPEAPTR